MRFLEKIIGTESERFVKASKETVKRIREYEKAITSYSDDKLREKTSIFKQRLSSGESLEDILPEAFAVVCEVSRRTTQMSPFDVQLIGGLALNKGSIAEMRTGEGKTLVAIFPAYLNALTGDPVHIVTVNDYLARRDAVWMGQVFAKLGLTVGVINGENKTYQYDPGHKEKDALRDTKGGYKIVYDFLREVPRKSAYKCDILYATNNELAFDYLRDNIEYDSNNIRINKFSFAIIDEVDSILIDEARSPLIISSKVNIPPSKYEDFAALADRFEEGEDYTIDEKTNTTALTADGIEKFEKALNIENVYVEGGQRTIHFLENALKAKSLYKKDKNYVVSNGEVVIVDEFTGRLQPGRQWSGGLHQAIEAKERVKVNQESRVYASITFQNFFRMYEKLSGMTGTAKSSEEEFFKVYNMPVISIPTNKPTQRKDYQDKIYQTHSAKIRAITKKVKDLHDKGQPVLVGTASIEHNEALSKKFKKAKIPHKVLNAKNHEQEGTIIAQAGAKGSVTIATNLAGRGVDIRLGGVDTDDINVKKEVQALGGLFVLGTERHESRRIDDQLRGRCGRQGDEGETEFFLSLEDNLTRVFGSDRILLIAKKLGLPEDEPIQNKMISSAIEGAQKRIEGHHFDSRRFSLQFDTVLNKHRSDVYEKRRDILINCSDETLMMYLPKDLLTIAENEKIKITKETLKQIILQSIDTIWMDHLESMSEVRSSVGLRSYGQREPLVEYKKEAARLFSGFWDNVKKYSMEIGKRYKEQHDKKNENKV